MSNGKFEKARLMLGLLESVERDGEQTQRRLAAELGVALGLINAYLKRCINKGLVKVRQAPAHRYAYYLTPQGLAEKSRLTSEYLSYSFSFLRGARASCSEVFSTARARGFNRLVLAGASELAEIAIICAIESEIKIVAVVDANSSRGRCLGLAVVQSFDAVSGEFDGVVLTDLLGARETYSGAVERFGVERVLAPSLLGLPVRDRKQGIVS